MSEEAKEFLNKWAAPEDPAESNSSSSDSSSSSSEDEEMEDVEGRSAPAAPKGTKRGDEEIPGNRPTKNRRLEDLWRPMDLM